MFSAAAAIRRTPPPPNYGDDFVSIWKTTVPNQEIIFNIGDDTSIGTTNCLIDWGDGSPKQTVISPAPTHIYAIPDEYVIRVSGTVVVFSTRSFGTGAQDMVELVQLGQVGWYTVLRTIDNADNMRKVNIGDKPAVERGQIFEFMSGCRKVTSVDLSNLPTPGVDVTPANTSGDTARGLCQGCAGLTEVIVGGLFDGMTSGVNTSSLSNAFFGCTNLTSLDLTGILDPSKIKFWDGIFTNTPWSTADYDAFLFAMRNRPKWDGVVFDAPMTQYSSAGAEARQYMIDNDNWTFNDAGQVP